jgi:FkbM family methyltransferase
MNFLIKLFSGIYLTLVDYLQTLIDKPLLFYPKDLPDKNSNVSQEVDFNLFQIASTYSLPIDGIIQVGAHHGQELPLFKQLDIKNLILFEPSKSAFEVLKKNLALNDGNVKVYNYALGNQEGYLPLHISSNDGQSSSFLKSNINFKIDSPQIQYSDIEIVSMKKLDDVEFDRTIFQTLVMDCEGYELEVLKGAKKTLKTINYIFLEVNRKGVRLGAPSVRKIDKYLIQFGFTRSLTRWWRFWGDAFYVKSI